MDKTTARCLIERHGFKLSDIRLIPEGRNHFVFDVVLDDGTRVIAKFKADPNGSDVRYDSLYGGRLSLQREAAIYQLVRETAELPAPRIYLKHESDEASFLLVEKLDGALWREYVAQHNFARESFLRSLEYLGQDIARLQRIRFPSYGNVMGPNDVSPTGIESFADRFIGVMDMRIDRAVARQVFSANDGAAMRRYFHSSFREIASSLGPEVAPPVMVFTDLHADNFLVDSDGRPSGYFDLESSQAAHAALEFCGLRLFLFNYFGAESFGEAETSFFSGYISAGGSYDPSRRETERLEHLLVTGRLLELTESYFEYRDGLRDGWSDRFKALFWQALQADRIDFAAVGDIYREKTGQPIAPRL